MKKRIKKTGEIVDVIDWLLFYNDGTRSIEDWVSYKHHNGDLDICQKGMNIYQDFEDVEEEPTKEIDWEERRYQIAKDTMQGLLFGFTATKEDVENNCHDVAQAAIMLADALIAELKKKGDENEQ